MSIRTEPFKNRHEAGRELAEALQEANVADSVVLAIPRGGVVVGYEVATAIGLPLDVIVPRKLRAPYQEELAIGAVASWGDHDSLIDEQSVRALRVSPEYINNEIDHQLAEVNRRLVAYRGTTNPPEIAGRTVLLIDDGIATGYTTRAAAVALRNLHASRIILAVPVGPADSLAILREYVDEIVCLKTPSPFMAVGYWYYDFQQVSDEEVIDLMEKARDQKAA